MISGLHKGPRLAVLAAGIAGALCAFMPGAAARPATHMPPVAALQPKPAVPASIAQADDPAQKLARLRLSDADTALYRRIFAAQRRGDTGAVAILEKQLNDTSLVDWARMRKPGAANMWLPQAVASTPRVYTSPLPRTAQEDEAARNIALSVGVLLKTDDIERAMGVVRRASAKGSIDRIETARLWAQIAAAKLYTNDAANALTLAHLALQIGGTVTPEAAWTAGLASWVLDDHARAARYFAWVPASPYAGPWMRSAAAFWAARALMRDGHYAEVSTWLREAARHPRSFYGLIATRALGARFDFNWAVPPFAERHHAILARHPGAVRALKLAQAGQMDMARLELTLLDEKDAHDWREALAALAAAALKPDVAIQVAEMLRHPAHGGTIDTALYPLAPWEPKDGYRLDPALLHAFIRQESRFKPAAVNKGSGATGLLQIMPRTARGVDSSTPVDALKNPETSLMLGQKYLEELLDRTDGNLFEAAIAYNAGPGNLATWKERFTDVSTEDPLLFIELIPYAETRAYVERVMANYWIYSLRMGPGDGGGVASLDAVAGGQPARYARATNRDSGTQIVLGAATQDSESR